MKRITTVLLSLLMLFSLMGLVVACSSQTAADSVLDTLLGAAETGCDEYVQSVKDASPEEYDSLKQDGQDLLKSLDEVDKALEDDSEDLSYETKKNVSERVTSLREKLNNALAELETKK